MTQPDKPRSLPAKLAEVMGTVKHIPKNGRNEAQRYDFVRDADVLDKVRDALAERNVAVLVDVSDCQHVEYQSARQRQEGGVSWMTTVAGALSFLDGDSDAVVTMGFRGVGQDTGDKGYYKAVTGGIKYALLKTFLIPTGDDPEADERPRHNAPQQAAPRPVARDTAPPAASPQRPPSAPVVTGGEGMSLRDALQALEGIDKRLISDKGKELYGMWSLKEMTADQRAHVVSELVGGGAGVPPAPSPAAADDEDWGGVFDQAPAA